MEETTILIVGAGPTGLSLAVGLGRMGIKTIILEKELRVNEDPRGIAIVGDAVRISHRLGIGPALTEKIGHALPSVCFHHGTFAQKPFLQFDQLSDWLQQSVPTTILQFQPNFERELRAEIAHLSSFVNLRAGCEVFGRVEEQDSVIVYYKDHDGIVQSIRTKWLIGADGKRGVVRKKFLEPEGVRQETGLYRYEGTWIAANLEITPPTPETHPDLPVWKLGYTTEEVYEMFWPKGFHFCNDGKRSAVSGRFGPTTSNFWRHEYSVEEGDSTENVLAEFWRQFEPWLSLPSSNLRGYLKGKSITFPRDCIKVMRCQSFQFAAKVVNQWFCRRTILIGDAAHVFPPFGGQGIAAGLRDALSLGWRLGMIERAHLDPALQQKLLNGWAHEQRCRVDEATEFTMVNGRIVNQRSRIFGLLDRMLMRLLSMIPWAGSLITKKVFADRTQMNECQDGFFLRHAGGGRKLAQIWIQSLGGRPTLSDSIILREYSQLALLVLVDTHSPTALIEIKHILQIAGLPDEILSMQSVTFLARLPTPPGPTATTNFELDDAIKELYYPCTSVDLEMVGIAPMKGYDKTSLFTRVGKTAEFVVVRPDLFIHSIAASLEQLLENLSEIRRYFS